MLYRLAVALLALGLVGAGRAPIRIVNSNQAQSCGSSQQHHATYIQLGAIGDEVTAATYLPAWMNYPVFYNNYLMQTQTIPVFPVANGARPGADVNEALTVQVHALPASTDLVTVDIGENDVLEAAASANPESCLSTSMNKYDLLLQALRFRGILPYQTILMNLRNVGYMMPRTQKAALISMLTAQFNKKINSYLPTYSYIVDQRCMYPDEYDPAMFLPGGVLPTATEQYNIAGHLEMTMWIPIAPPETCAYSLYPAPGSGFPAPH